jgi:hypothetical protein
VVAGAVTAGDGDVGTGAGTVVDVVTDGSGAVVVAVSSATGSSARATGEVARPAMPTSDSTTASAITGAERRAPAAWSRGRRVAHRDVTSVGRMVKGVSARNRSRTSAFSSH